MNSEQVERHIRYRITGLLHVGRLKPGDLLPSIRSLAKEIGDLQLENACLERLSQEKLPPNIEGKSPEELENIKRLPTGLNHTIAQLDNERSNHRLCICERSLRECMAEESASSSVRLTIAE